MDKKIISAAILVLAVIVVASVLLVTKGSQNKSLEDALAEGKSGSHAGRGSLQTEETRCLEYKEIDGSVVTSRIPYGTCSGNKPGYCKNGSLVNNCRLCGCGEDEKCAQNGECVIGKNPARMGGGGEGGAGDEGSAPGGGKQATDDGCTDPDVSTIPNPVYQSGTCTDRTGSYSDSCENPQSKIPSTVWIKEYRCQNTGEERVCVGEYRSCPSLSDNYFGSNDSACSSNKCIIPETCSDGIQNQDETGIDCGGTCTPCPTANCTDNIQNQDETGIDCGGVCTPCDGSGGGQSEDCYVQPLDEKGFTIFTSSNCYDKNSAYSNTCKSPVGGGQSDVFIRTFVCVNNLCTPKYYSCPVMGDKYYGDGSYICNSGVCTT